MGGNDRARKSRTQVGKTQLYKTKRTAEELETLDDLGLDPQRKIKVISNKSNLSKNIKTTSSSKRYLFSTDDNETWSPTPYSAFKLLVSARFAAALWTTISDCDETYNYWEPTHYLLYGKGFQTWEYSPEFALRSYTYILLHAVPAKIYDYFLKPNPLLVFFFIRCFLAFISALTEVFLYRAVRRYLGGNISRVALITSLFSAGMFISSSAYLPSAFSSYMTALAIGAWLEELYELSIFAVAISSIVSWPFAALTGFLIAFDIVLLQQKFLLFLTWATISLVVILLPLVYIDSTHYGKLVIAPFNIVKYNILSSKGPDLYGTEPWSFYIVNGFLNFNLVFILTLLSPILLFFTWGRVEAKKEKLIILGTTLLWLFVFICQPHKEERFLFPIFPLIPICGGIGVDALQHVFLKCFGVTVRVGSKVSEQLTKWLLAKNVQSLLSILGFFIIFASCIMSSSRVISLHYNYRAPFDIYFNLQRDGSFQRYESELGKNELLLCYGKEWHRFPASFFLPSPKWNIRFIKSDFQGQLPNLYAPFDSQGTSRVPEHMNDLNKEETSRYVDVNECNFLVDFVSENSSPNEPNYAESKEWNVVSEQEFLDAPKSHPFFRAFYIPFISSHFTEFKRYVFLERRRKKIKKKIPSGREFSDDLSNDDF